MNVADFQQNKTMIRQHTHDFIKNTSKPRISRGGSGKGNNRAPAKKTEPSSTSQTSQRNPQSGVNVNLYFGGMGGRTSLNDVSQFQYVPQGMGIPIHMGMPQGIQPLIQVPQGLPQVVPPVAPVPIMGGGMPLGGAIPPPPNNPPNNLPNNNLDWMRPVMTDITDAFREQRNILTDLRNQMNQSLPNQDAIRQQIIDTETNFTQLMMNTNIESLEIQRDYFNNLNRNMGDSVNRLRAEVVDDTRNALGNMRTELNRTIRGQSEEVIDAAARTSQAMNLRLEELTNLANINTTQGILALPLKRGGGKNEKNNLQRETIIQQLDNPNLSQAQRSYLESSLVATQEASKLGEKPQKIQDNDTTDEETADGRNFDNSMGAAAGGSQRPTPVIEFSQRPSPISASIVQERPTTQPRSLMFLNDEDETNLVPTTLFKKNEKSINFPATPSIFSNNDDDRSEQFDYGSDFSADYPSMGGTSDVDE